MKLIDQLLGLNILLCYLYRIIVFLTGVVLGVSWRHLLSQYRLVISTLTLMDAGLPPTDAYSFDWLKGVGSKPRQTWATFIAALHK